MDREQIGLQARICQLGQHKTARRLALFEALLRLLRRGLVFGWLRSWPQFRPSAIWIALLCGSLLFYGLSLWLSACERLIGNRWMNALRRRRHVSCTELLLAFTRRDALLAVRVSCFYRLHLFGRYLLLFSVPAVLTAAAVLRIAEAQVSRAVFYGGTICLTLIWLCAAFFSMAAREPLQAAVALQTDPECYAQRKSSLARMDKDCFQLLRFCFSWLMLPRGARRQAKAIYASIRQ